MRFIHQALSDVALHTRQADVEASAEEVAAVRQVQVHFGVDGDVGRQRDFLFAGHKPDRTFKTSRPAGSEQLLRIGADAHSAGSRKLDIEAAIGATGRAVFAAARGVGSGRVHDFSKLIWQLASPKWDFDDATFDRTAAAFDNPDHVAIVIHNYRWRLGLADGEAKYDDLEKRLAAAPVISVPTITPEGDANGAPHPDPSSYAKKFSGKYSFRLIKGGVGHNLPQEAPRAFAEAIIDVAEV